jgi:hypothetical protein
MELEYQRPTGGSVKPAAQPVAPTSLAFHENDANHFVVGCETGAVYTAARCDITGYHPVMFSGL